VNRDLDRRGSRLVMVDLFSCLTGRWYSGVGGVFVRVGWSQVISLFVSRRNSGRRPTIREGK
jgi:hypothetical protein